jgi:GMP synthase (glutamine-hydrolysing)
MRTLIIDNYSPNSPQIEILYNILQDVAVHTVEVKSYTSIHSVEDIKLYDILILSGSQHILSDSEVSESYAIEVDLVRELKKPILGICHGHQLLGMAFGENIISTGTMLDGYYMVRRLSDDKIFEGLGEKFLVRESHEEIIENLPYDFILLADSPSCQIEVMKHVRLPIYGVQFHPERFDDKRPAGGVILENFFKLAALYM